MKFKRRGFTLVEILVAVAIIALLTGILTLGMRTVNRSGRLNATKVDLGNLRGMLAEFDARTALSKAPSAWYWGGASHAPAVGENFWKVVYLNSGVSQSLPAPGRVDDESPALRFNSDAVLNTQLAMGQILAIPANKAALLKIPGDRLFKVTTGATTLLTLDTSGAPSPSMLVDAWGNPIIFVPSSGLRVELLKNGSKYTGTANFTVVSPEGQYDPTADAVTKPGRPFWTSAGPDGDFLKGDDNVYSFEN